MSHFIQQVTGPIRTYWSGLTTREQRLLILLGGAVTLTLIVWLGLSLRQSLVDADQRITTAQQRYEQVARLVKDIKQRQQTSPAGRSSQSSGTTDLQSVISQTARAANLDISRLQPVARDGMMDAGMRVWLNKAQPDQLFGWIITLHQQHGLTVSAFSGEPATDVDQVKSRGLTVQITLERS